MLSIEKLSMHVCVFLNLCNGCSSFLEWHSVRVYLFVQIYRANLAARKYLMDSATGSKITGRNNMTENSSFHLEWFDKNWAYSV